MSSKAEIDFPKETEESEIVDPLKIKEMIKFFEDLIESRVVNEEKLSRILYFSGPERVLPSDLEYARVALIENVKKIIWDNKRGKKEDYTFTDDQLKVLKGLVAVLRSDLKECNVRDLVDTVLT